MSKIKHSSDLKKVIPNLKNSNSIDYGKYSVADFLRDMNKVTDGKTDKKLSKTITLIEGDKFHVPTGLKHQMFALKDTELFEFSTQHFDSDSNRIERGD